MSRKSSTSRPARKFDVVLVAITNTVTGATVEIPQVGYTATNIQAAINSGANADIRCASCGESVADCPDVQGLVQAPAAWSWRSESVGVRHADGLVIFA